MLPLKARLNVMALFTYSPIAEMHYFIISDKTCCCLPLPITDTMTPPTTGSPPVLPCTLLVWSVTLLTLLLLWILLSSSLFQSGKVHTLVTRQPPCTALVPLHTQSHTKESVSMVPPLPSPSQTLYTGDSTTDRMFLDSLCVDVCTKAELFMAKNSLKIRDKFIDKKEKI